MIKEMMKMSAPKLLFSLHETWMNKFNMIRKRGCSLPNVNTKKITCLVGISFIWYLVLVGWLEVKLLSGRHAHQQGKFRTSTQQSLQRFLQSFSWSKSAASTLSRDHPSWSLCSSDQDWDFFKVVVKVLPLSISSSNECEVYICV